MNKSHDDKINDDNDNPTVATETVVIPQLEINTELKSNDVAAQKKKRKNNHDIFDDNNDNPTGTNIRVMLRLIQFQDKTKTKTVSFSLFIENTIQLTLQNQN